MLTKAVREEPTSHHLHMQSEALGARPAAAAAGFVEEGGLDRFGGLPCRTSAQKGEWGHEMQQICGQTG